jgi:curved DNA-binding protein CbpA
MPRPTLPDDDLYVRLGVPSDASVETIEVAWRALLRRHHPDIAGDVGLELAKRINVAHDWLTDPALRDRYDRDRGLRSGARGVRDAAWHARGPGRGTPDAAPPRTRPRPTDEATAIARFIERLRTLSPTDLDRLALAEPPPIAFAATIRRFLPPDRLAALDAMELAVARTRPEAADQAAARDAIDGYATELVLGPFLDELLSEPFRGRTRERLTRGWEAAVGQPRYGPNTGAVEALLGRIAALDAAGIRATGATAARVTGGAPWPPGLSADDDDALRVSTILSSRDAATSVPPLADAATTARARRAVARLAHLLVLRHAFPAAIFADLTAAWRPWLLPPDPVPPRVRRPPLDR